MDQRGGDIKIICFRTSVARKCLLLSSDIPAAQRGLFTRYIYIFFLHGLALLPPWNDLSTLGAGLIPLFAGPPVPGSFLKADAGGVLFENPALPELF